MIAIDTNVLLRYLLQDDAAQFHKAKRLINGTEEILVTDVVLTETIWTLAGKKYNLSPADLVMVIRSLFRETNIKFENSQVVWLALNDYVRSQKASGKKPDFPDALILRKSQYFIEASGQSFGGLYSFDTGAQKLVNVNAP